MPVAGRPYTHSMGEFLKFKDFQKRLKMLPCEMWLHLPKNQRKEHHNIMNIPLIKKLPAPAVP